MIQTSDQLAPKPAFEPSERGSSLWHDAWLRLRKNKMAMAGGIIVIFLMLVSFLAPVIAPYSYETQDLNLYAVGPQAHHWFGTDTLGRDVLTRLLYGGRVSMSVGLAATAVSLVIGVLYGAIAGYIGGRLDSAMMRFVDIMYSMPFIIFVILLMVMFGRHFVLLFVAIGAVEWLTMARIVRGQVAALKHQEFIEAARALGLRKRRIILRHLIPNTLGPVVVYATLTVPSVMLLEATLSFLGLGVQPPMSSWGLMINEGAQYIEEAPWLLIFPGAALALTLFSLNFLGDGLRDALDVRASKD
jgi:oligopeptide transport system permease protein